MLQFHRLERFDRARVHLGDVHGAGDGERVEPALAQPPVQLVLLGQFGGSGLVLPPGTRGSVAVAEARGELRPALLEPLPQLGMLGQDAPGAEQPAAE